MTLIKLSPCFIALVFGILFACSSTSVATVADVSNSSFVIYNTTVINPRKGTVSPHTSVIVQSGVIMAVVPASEPIPRGYDVIEGRGRFLIPGLWDAHTHLSKTGQQSLALFIANGITGVRDMGSNLDEVASWKRLIAEGRLLGPHIMMSGPMIEDRSNLARMANDQGVEAFARQRIGVANPAEGRLAVQSLANAGVDQIKMRTSPDLATFIAISREAAARGLPFAAHPFGRAEDMLNTGVDSLEHLLERAPSKRTSAERFSLFRGVLAAKIHISNTLVNVRGLLTPYKDGRRILASASGHSDKRRKYLCGYILRDWAEQVEENRASPFRQLAPALSEYSISLHELDRMGVALLAGSDAGVMFTYPGFSMHDELELMVTRVGLQPMRVLQIATDGVPGYFGRQGSMGAIENGQSADLVLLDANPLKDIRNTRRIVGVMTPQGWLNRQALNEVLDATERDAKGKCVGGSHAGDP